MDASITRSGGSEWNKTESGRRRGHFGGIRSARRSGKTIGSSAFRSGVNPLGKGEIKMSDSSSSFTPLAGRILMSVLFLISGFFKIGGYSPLFRDSRSH